MDAVLADLVSSAHGHHHTMAMFLNQTAIVCNDVATVGHHVAADLVVIATVNENPAETVTKWLVTAGVRPN